MVYVILVIGLILIFLALKGKTINKNKDEETFDNLVESSTDDFYEREILKSYVELENKVVELESKIYNLEQKLNFKDKEFNIFYENIKKEIKINKTTNNNFDNNVTDDLNGENEVVDVENEDKNFQNTIKNNEVLSLYNEGKSVDEIASTLRLGKGEVLLRIGLNKREV